MLAAFLKQSSGGAAPPPSRPDPAVLARKQCNELTEVAQEGFGDFKRAGLSIFAVLEDMAATNNTSRLSTLSKEACVGLRQFIRGVREFERRRAAAPILPSATVELVEERLLKWRDTSVEVLAQLREELEASVWCTDSAQRRTEPGRCAQRGIEVFEDQLYILSKIGGPEWVFCYAESPRALRIARGEEVLPLSEDDSDSEPWSDGEGDSFDPDEDAFTCSTDSELENDADADADAGAAVEEVELAPVELSLLDFELDNLVPLMSSITSVGVLAPLVVIKKKKKRGPQKPQKPMPKKPKKPSPLHRFKNATWAVRATLRAAQSKDGIKDLIRMERDEVVRRAHVASREDAAAVAESGVGPGGRLHDRMEDELLLAQAKKKATAQRQHHDRVVASIRDKGHVKAALYAAAEKAAAKAAASSASSSGRLGRRAMGRTSSAPVKRVALRPRRIARAATLEEDSRSVVDAARVARARVKSEQLLSSLPVLPVHLEASTLRTEGFSGLQASHMAPPLVVTHSPRAVHPASPSPSPAAAAGATAASASAAGALGVVGVAAIQAPLVVTHARDAGVAPTIAPVVVTHRPDSPASST